MVLLPVIVVPKPLPAPKVDELSAASCKFPPAKVTVSAPARVPRALAFSRRSVPALSVVCPAKLLLPRMVHVLLPALTKFKGLPVVCEIVPLSRPLLDPVRVRSDAALVVMFPLSERPSAAVSSVLAAPTVIPLLKVRAAPEATKEPPLRAMLLVPRAVLLPSAMEPAVRVVVPV